jgi:hypothetical protein
MPAAGCRVAAVAACVVEEVTAEGCDNLGVVNFCSQQ